MKCFRPSNVSEDYEERQALLMEFRERKVEEYSRRLQNGRPLFDDEGPADSYEDRD